MKQQYNEWRDRYDEIGQGRHSVVYKGRKKQTIKYVAIKSVEKDQREKITREVRILSRIKHPNCLHFFNWYETRNHIWLVLEYCTGGDLLRVLKDDRHLPSSALKVLGVDLLSGLHYLHSHGILYCDLKPSNVLIDEYGVLKLCDFGLARKIPRSTGNKARKRGTPCYMAPELFTEDGVYSIASDLWGLGCLLYEMAVGKPPFVSSGFEDLVHLIMTAPVPLSAEDTLANSDGMVELDEELKDLLRGLLRKVPIDRRRWPELLDHRFWDACPTPFLAEMPEEPLYDKMMAPCPSYNALLALP